jgi:hypothetical protein
MNNILIKQTVNKVLFEVEGDWYRVTILCLSY